MPAAKTAKKSWHKEILVLFPQYGLPIITPQQEQKLEIGVFQLLVYLIQSKRMKVQSETALVLQEEVDMEMETHGHLLNTMKNFHGMHLYFIIQV